MAGSQPGQPCRGNGSNRAGRSTYCPASSHSRAAVPRLLLHVQNLLENQIRLINEDFAKAIADSSYRGHYRGVS